MAHLIAMTFDDEIKIHDESSGATEKGLVAGVLLGAGGGALQALQH